MRRCVKLATVGFGGRKTQYCRRDEADARRAGGGVVLDQEELGGSVLDAWVPGSIAAAALSSGLFPEPPHTTWHPSELIVFGTEEHIRRSWGERTEKPFSDASPWTMMLFRKFAALAFTSNAMT